MRSSKKCPKCSSLRIGFIPYQPDIGENEIVGRALGIARGFGFLGQDRAIGNLEAYVCTECGYHESYVVNPSRLDWAQIRELVMLNAPRPKTKGPVDRCVLPLAEASKD